MTLEESTALKLRLPVSMAIGSKSSLESPFVFSVAVETTNVSEFRLIVDADPQIFANAKQETSFEMPSRSGHKRVEITLVPIARTKQPTWVNVSARSDAVAQAAGFFIEVV